MERKTYRQVAWKMAIMLELRLVTEMSRESTGLVELTLAWSPPTSFRFLAESRSTEMTTARITSNTVDSAEERERWTVSRRKELREIPRHVPAQRMLYNGTEHLGPVPSKTSTDER
jgi:hypothetical protein